MSDFALINDELEEIQDASLVLYVLRRQGETLKGTIDAQIEILEIAIGMGGAFGGGGMAALKLARAVNEADK